jgi:hypothetical protein
MFSKCKRLKKKKERKIKKEEETGSHAAHTLKGGIPGPNPISCLTR